MANQADRFIKIYSQGTLNSVEILVDSVTGVNYLFTRSGNSGGLTALLNPDGSPVVTPIARPCED